MTLSDRTVEIIKNSVDSIYYHDCDYLDCLSLSMYSKWRKENVKKLFEREYMCEWLIANPDLLLLEENRFNYGGEFMKGYTNTKELQIKDAPWYRVVDIKELDENKRALMFTFNDGTKIRTVRSKEDEFDIEYASAIALAKFSDPTHLLTPYGIEEKAKWLMEYKAYEKEIVKAKKLYNKILEAKEKEKTEAEKRNQIEADRKIRKAKKLEERRAEERKSLVSLIADGIAKWHSESMK